MVSLFVSSHYKNTPNDLLLMADAPAHHMFALLAPVDETQVCACVWHVCARLRWFPSWFGFMCELLLPAAEVAFNGQ